MNNKERVFVFSSKSPFEFTPRLTNARFAHLFQLTAIKYFVYSSYNLNNFLASYTLIFSPFPKTRRPFREKTLLHYPLSTRTNFDHKPTVVYFIHNFKTFLIAAIFKHGNNTPRKEKSWEFKLSSFWRKSLYFLPNTDNLSSLILLIVTAVSAGWVNMKETLLRVRKYF